MSKKLRIAYMVVVDNSETGTNTIAGLWAEKGWAQHKADELNKHRNATCRGRYVYLNKSEHARVIRLVEDTTYGQESA